MNRNVKTVLAGLCVSALATLSLSVLSLPVMAAEPSAPAPTPGTKAAPPPPAMVDEKAAAKADPRPAATPERPPGDPELEPQVTIIERGDETHEEVRVNGTIRYIKVTPKVGPVYYLVPVSGTETYMRRDSLDSNLRVPMWQVHSW